MGFSVELRNRVADAINRNTPLVVPVLAASIYKADPDADDGSNAAAALIDTAEPRSQIAADAASDGVATATGDSTSWEVEEGTTLTHVGLHDAISGGTWLGSERVDQPVQVADGDVVSLASYRIEVD